jgi:hypothetical protein
MDAVQLIKADHPAVEAKARKDGEATVKEAVEEHHLVKITLAELGRSWPS